MNEEDFAFANSSNNKNQLLKSSTAHRTHDNGLPLASGHKSSEQTGTPSPIGKRSKRGMSNTKHKYKSSEEMW